jgi:phosphoglucosamine mutase
MSSSLFGTDGVRGRANSAPMTAEIAMRIGMAAGQVFNRGDHRHRVVIGKDTRLSGYMIEQALGAGFLSVGIDVLLLGPLPTPAVGFLTRAMRADVGVMISASHNPYEDNGIKLFGPDGYKLSDAVEMQIEELVTDSAGIRLAAAGKIGRAKRLDDAEGRYIEAVKASSARGLNLSGLKIVVDCANGAACGRRPCCGAQREVILLAVPPRRILIITAGRRTAVLQDMVCTDADSASRLTATPTGRAGRRTGAADRRRSADGDHRQPVVDRWTPGRRRSGRHRDVQSRARALSRCAQAHAGADQGGRSQRPRAHARRRLQPRWRAIRPHHHDRSRHDR